MSMEFESLNTLLNGGTLAIIAVIAWRVARLEKEFCKLNDRFFDHVVNGTKDAVRRIR